MKMALDLKNHGKEYAKFFLWTFLFGIFVHIFGLVNTLSNYDDIIIQPTGVGSSLVLGRWFLRTLDILTTSLGINYNLPWLNGAVFIFFIALSAVLVISVLGIEKRLYALIVGFAMVSFPAVTSVMFFKYTTIYYGLSLLFAAAAVWLSTKWKYAFPCSVLLLALSLGIYQAYFPVAVTLYLLLLVKQALDEEASFVQLVKRGVYYLATLVAGLVLYFVILNAYLAAVGNELVSYQGLSTMGAISLSQYPRFIAECVKNFFLMPVNGYCALATGRILKGSYLVLGAISIFLLALSIIKRRKTPLKALSLALFALLLPIGINLISVMSPDSDIYTIMVYPFVFVLCLPLLLLSGLEKAGAVRGIPTKLLGTGAVFFVSLIVAMNTYYANVNYSSIYYANRQVENYFNSVLTQVHMTEGYDTGKKWVILGQVDNKFFNVREWGKPHIYGGNTDAAGLANAYSRVFWMHNYMGHTAPYANDTESAAVAKLPEVSAMPTWPDYGSIKVVDEYLVIKLGEQ